MQAAANFLGLFIWRVGGIEEESWLDISLTLSSVSLYVGAEERPIQYFSVHLWRVLHI